MKSQFNILFFVALIVLVYSCNNTKPGSWKNEQISSDKREKFHQLNDDVFKLIKADDTKRLESFLSKELIESPYTLRQVELVGNQLKASNYSIYDEYYTINKWENKDTIRNTDRGINSYSLYFGGITREMYIAFFVPKTGIDRKMITAIYCKFDYGWKLAQLDVGSYMINGKTGPELYRLAKDKAKINYISDAVSIMELSNTCFRPDDIMRYPEDRVSSGFYKNILDLANERVKFPFIITQVPTLPRIFRIFNNKTDDGYYPVIYYQSHIPIHDTVGMLKENKAIEKIIGKIIPGMDKDKKRLFYSAFNTMPNLKKSVDHFDFTQVFN